jgi:hypothetical protein
MSYVIFPEGGLCNMLRVVFSWYAKALAEDKKLIVCWPITDACPGFFLDYFEPVSDIEFIKGYNPLYRYDYQGCGVLEEFNNPSMYDALCPRVNIKAIVDSNIAKLNFNSGCGFVAIHVRRTDHVRDAKMNNKFTSDEDFFEFLDKQLNKVNIYLATDNLETQRIFKARYGNRLKINKWITPRLDLRQTDIKDAVIDILTCAHANAFLGSGWSSFSDLINDLRVL